MSKNARRASHGAHDWVAIKAAFVQGMEVEGKRVANPLLRDVAERFGASESTVKKRSMAEKWVDERLAFQAQLEARQRRQTTVAIAGEASAFNAKSLRVAEKIIDAIEKSLTGELTSVEVRQKAGALKDAQHVGRLAMGESTENVQQDSKDDDDARAEAIANRLAAKLSAGSA